jgi:hypothetical protein
MNTNEILTLQALKFKQELLRGEQDLPTDAPEWMRDVDPGNDDTRNICALISVPLFEQINTVCSVLSMSKRRFVELALRDLTEKAVQAIADVGLTNVTSMSVGDVSLDQE